MMKAKILFLIVWSLAFGVYDAVLAVQAVMQASWFSVVFYSSCAVFMVWCVLQGIKYWKWLGADTAESRRHRGGYHGS